MYKGLECFEALPATSINHPEVYNMGYGKISTKQQEILDYIKDEILKKGYPPTVREICETVHLKSTSSVHSHLETLEKNGYIKRDPTKPRAIEICDDNFQMVRTEMVSIPIIGNVAAGQPIFAEENIREYYPVPADSVPKGESFILNVRGESMINAGIFNGDKIFVNVTDNAHNGDIVVALIDDSATVKTFYKENNHIRLQPENDTMEPIIVDDCKILGKVYGVMRFFR
jgi:repressor LexA